VSQSGFNPAFGKRPAPPARAHQQELDSALSEPVADSGHLIGTAQLAQVFQPNAGPRQTGSSIFRPFDRETLISGTHISRVPERCQVWLEHRLVQAGNNG
jgi:hypothetical protein